MELNYKPVSKEVAIDILDGAIDSGAYIWRIQATDAAGSERSIPFVFSKELSRKLLMVVRTDLTDG